MSNKKSEKYAKRPFIVSLIYYIFGFVQIIIAVWLTSKFFNNINNDGAGGIIAFTIMILIIIGMGLLSIVVGYKRRKW